MMEDFPISLSRPMNGSLMIMWPGVTPIDLPLRSLLVGSKIDLFIDVIRQMIGNTIQN